MTLKAKEFFSMAEGGFSALRVAVVVGFIAAAIYHCPQDAIEQLSARSFLPMTPRRTRFPQ